MNGIARVDLVAVCACMRVCGAFLRDTCIFYIPVSGLALPLGTRLSPKSQNKDRIISASRKGHRHGTGHRYWSQLAVNLLFTLYTLSSFLEIRLYIPPFLGSKAMFFIRELIAARVQGSS